MEIIEAIKTAFNSVGQKELSVDQIYRYIAFSIPEYDGIGLDILKRRIKAFLNRDLKSKTPNFTRAINPKTKKLRKQVYCLTSINCTTSKYLKEY